MWKKVRRETNEKKFAINFAVVIIVNSCVGCSHGGVGVGRALASGNVYEKLKIEYIVFTI